MTNTGLIDYVNGPLCPHSMAPMSIEHSRAVDTANAMYQAATIDADTAEMTPEQDIMYRSLPSDRMRLYREAWAGTIGRLPADVEAIYWRCQTCGFVLPASRIRT